MVCENRKVLLISTVRNMLVSQEWPIYLFFNNEHIFKNDKGEIIAVPRHPIKPNLIYLSELLNRVPFLRQEFIEAARPEWDLLDDKTLYDNLSIDLWLDPGNAEVSDIQNLFSALSELNRTVGGFGFDWHQAEPGIV